MEFYTIQNDELKHHGILGQKWGVRRYQNKDGSLTPAGKARKGYDPQTHTIGAGTKVTRVAMVNNRNGDVADINARRKAYVSLNKRDNKYWKEQLWDRGYKREIEAAGPAAFGWYGLNTTYETIKPLRVADKKAIDKIVDDMQKNKETRADMQDAVFRHAMATGLDPNVALGHGFIRSLVLDTPASDEYFNRLRKEGYDAVEDLFGKSSMKKSGLKDPTPTIILDPEKTLRVKKQKVLR